MDVGAFRPPSTIHRRNSSSRSLLLRFVGNVGVTCDKRALAVKVALVTVALLGVSASAMAGELPAPRSEAAGRRAVLQTFPAGSYTFEVAMDDCASALQGASPGDAHCTFAVRLLDGEKVLDRAAFAQTACGPASPGEATPALTTSRLAKVWSTSDEHCEVDLTAQTVELGAGTTALLVTQLQGFEYRYRSHRLYVPKKGDGTVRLQAAWSVDEDGDATHWSTATAVTHRKVEGGQDVAFVDLTRAPTGVVSRFSMERLHFDPTSSKLTRSRLPDGLTSLFVLQLGKFRSVEELNKARGRCLLRDLVMLRGALFPALKLPTYFLGAVFVTRDDAEAVVASVRECSETRTAAVVEYKSATPRDPNPVKK